MNVFSSFIDKLGPTGSALLLIVVGGLEILPDSNSRLQHILHGSLVVAGGIVVLVFGRTFAKAEAEKRIDNPHLPSTSSVPSIQAEIDRQQKVRSSGVS